VHFTGTRKVPVPESERESLAGPHPVWPRLCLLSSSRGHLPTVVYSRHQATLPGNDFVSYLVPLSGLVWQHDTLLSRPANPAVASLLARHLDNDCVRIWNSNGNVPADVPDLQSVHRIRKLPQAPQARDPQT
jgi:hypothetical protein